MCIRICVFNFKKQTNKQKQKQEYKKAKEAKEEKRIYLENQLKKLICGCINEDFSHHLHFQKQEFFLAKV